MENKEIKCPKCNKKEVTKRGFKKMKVTKKYLKELIRNENKIICELRKEENHHQRSYPISLCEGKIKAYKDLMEIKDE